MPICPVTKKCEFTVPVAAISVGDWGIQVEHRRREDRGAEGAEGGRSEEKKNKSQHENIMVCPIRRP